MTITVLAVDDSASMRALIASVIQSLEFDCLLAASGEEALGLFTANPIDLVILDVELPGIDGFEICRHMRTLRQSDWFPVIYLSASHSEHHIIKGLEAGGDAYVSKPINADVLQSIVKAMGRIATMKNALASANKTLEKLANSDGLTHILNRRGFEEALDRYWRQSQRDQTSIAVMLMDVDHFKLFNDNYGHIAGDDALKQVAKALETAALRPLDIVARYGGEEFVVVLPNTALEGAVAIAGRILTAIQDLNIKHDFSSCSNKLSLSIGIATPQADDTVEQLLEHADQALYCAKENGRNQYTVHSP